MAWPHPAARQLACLTRIVPNSECGSDKHTMALRCNESSRAQVQEVHGKARRQKLASALRSDWSHAAPRCILPLIGEGMFSGLLFPLEIKVFKLTSSRCRGRSRAPPKRARTSDPLRHRLSRSAQEDKGLRQCAYRAHECSS